MSFNIIYILLNKLYNNYHNLNSEEVYTSVWVENNVEKMNNLNLNQNNNIQTPTSRLLIYLVVFHIRYNREILYI